MTFRPIPLLVPSVLAGLLAGCAVGPDYQRPQIASSGEWLEPAALDPVDVAWWKHFADPQFDALVERALAANPGLREARARLAEARALRGVAQAGQLPEGTLSASANETRISENGQLPVGQIPGFDPEFSLFDAGFDASWELDLWGGKARKVEAARAREEAAGWAQRDVMVALLAELARNYVTFRANQEKLALAEEELAANDRLAMLAQLLREAGETTGIEADRAASARGGAMAARDLAKADMAAAAYRIAGLLGTPPEQIVPELLASEAPIPVPPENITSGVRSDLLERRSDIRGAESDLAAATADVGVSTAQLYPHFSLMGGIGLQAQNAGDLTDGGSLRYLVGPGFNWPIFSLNRVRAQIKASGARADAAAARYEGAVMGALTDSEAAANRYAASVNAARAARGALDRETHAFTLADMRFTSGEDSRLILEQARLRLVQVKRADVDARAGRTISAVGFYKALGGGWETAD